MQCNVINADDPKFQYYGRMDFSNPNSIRMYYPGSYIKARFEGKSIKVRFSQMNQPPNYIGYIIDGDIEGKFVLKQNTVDEVYNIEEDLNEGIHDLILIRRNDHGRGYCDFNGLVLEKDKKLLKLPAGCERKIECFGDSITAGVLSEAFGYEGKSDPEHDGQYCNGWYSFGNILARSVNADVHNNGQGGLALVDGYGYFSMPYMLGLETTYDKLNPYPLFEGGLTKWDFNKYTPHIVIIAVGQNDSSTFPQVLFDETLKSRWKRRYREVVHSLRLHYPKAYFILSTTLMEHDTRWDDILFEIAEEMKDTKIIPYRYKRVGKGSPGHLRRSEAEEMALELKELIDTLEDPWQEKLSSLG